jgi:hypothetical protein
MKSWIGMLVVCVGLGGQAAAQSTVNGSLFSRTEVRNSAAIVIGGDHSRAAIGGIEIVGSTVRGQIRDVTEVRNSAAIVIGGDHSTARIGGVSIR